MKERVSVAAVVVVVVVVLFNFFAYVFFVFVFVFVGWFVCPFKKQTNIFLIFNETHQ